MKIAFDYALLCRSVFRSGTEILRFIYSLFRSHLTNERFHGKISCGWSIDKDEIGINHKRNQMLTRS